MSEYDKWFPTIYYRESNALMEEDSYESFNNNAPLTQYQREKWALQLNLKKARQDLVREVHVQDRYHSRAYDKKRQYVSKKTMQNNLKTLREAVKKAQQDLDVLEVRKLLHNW